MYSIVGQGTRCHYSNIRHAAATLWTNGWGNWMERFEEEIVGKRVLCISGDQYHRGPGMRNNARRTPPTHPTWLLTCRLPIINNQQISHAYLVGEILIGIALCTPNTRSVPIMKTDRSKTLKERDRNLQKDFGIKTSKTVLYKLKLLIISGGSEKSDPSKYLVVHMYLFAFNMGTI